jgi:hypothetical protein
MSSASPRTAATRALCIARAAAKVGPRPPLAATSLAGEVALTATAPPRSTIHKPCGACIAVRGWPKAWSRHLPGHDRSDAGAEMRTETAHRQPLECHVAK